MTAWTRAAVLTPSMDPTKGSYTDGFAEVNMSGDGCGTDVEPIWIVGSEFFVCSGLDDIDPGWNLEFTYKGVLDIEAVETRTD